MKFDFEKDIERNMLSMSVINARRFGRAVRDALDGLELEARCYGLKNEDFYLTTMAYLERLEARLKATTSGKEQG